MAKAKVKKKGRPLQNDVKDSGYLNIDELSDYIRFSKSHIYTLKSQNKIPYLKVVGKILFDKAEIEKWLKSKSVAPKI
jgi:excisionase family DNA binding protein